MSTNADISAAWIESATTIARIVDPLQPTPKLLRGEILSARLQLHNQVEINVGVGILISIDVSYVLTDQNAKL